MFDIILALIALGILVTVHETGHFIAARLCGVKVETFSIGFGKPIFKFTRKEIEYKIGWLPLGGYVKMKGESLEETESEEPDSFRFTKWWKKIIIAFSGPFANLLFALLIFILVFMFPSRVEDLSPVVGKATGDYSLLFAQGDSILSVNATHVKGWYQFISNLSQESQNSILLVREKKKVTITLPQVDITSLSEQVMPSVPAIVGDVSPGMPAWKAGLKPGDRIVRVDSTAVENWYDMRESITKSALDTVVITVQRNGIFMTKVMSLESNPLTDGQKIIGITQSMPVTYTQSNTPLKAFEYGAKSTLSFIVINYVGLYKVISQPKTLKSSVGGPVMIYSLSSQSARKGFSAWIMFVAAISLVLMIMNLLPIPVLDGGHIMFAILQGITGKPLSARIQIILQNIGLALLLMLMFYAFYNDFTKVFTRAVSTMGNP